MMTVLIVLTVILTLFLGALWAIWRAAEEETWHHTCKRRAGLNPEPLPFHWLLTPCLFGHAQDPIRTRCGTIYYWECRRCQQLLTPILPVDQEISHDKLST